MPESENTPAERKFHYFVDGEKYESDEAHLTGAVIKSRLPEPKRSEPLYLEGHGDPQPILITDDTRVSLDEGPKYFSTTLEKEHYFYFVDGEKYESDEAQITGAVIISRLPEPKRTYALYIEGQGNEPDQLIKPETSISLEKHKQHRLYTVPPASFGS